MKKLKKEFTKAGFHHKLVKRVGKVAIYERRQLTGERSHYEVVKISNHKGYKMGGTFIEPAETYPGNSLWGLQGWTCDDLMSAQERFKEVCKRFNKEAACV
tara:strand:- start:7691 stop:7993 length:303 start_codon:yes stop_codon:yes gene_type:complete